MKKNEIKKDAAQMIADKFITLLEQGTCPWVRPWELWTSWSRLTGSDYQGANMLLLSGGEYVTFNQVKKEGGKINKGAKSKQIVNYKRYTKTVKDVSELPAELQLRCYIDAETGETKLDCKSLKYYNVFSIEDTTLEQKHEKETGTRHDWNSHEKADELINAYTNAANIHIHEGSNQAFEMGGTLVVLPKMAQFKSAAEFYSTMFHELIHSTAKTVDRDLSGYHKSKKARAREELVAEIGAAYVMSYLGIETEFSDANSAAYMKSWAQHLKDDASAILYAAPKAIEAANVIINSIEELKKAA